ncbi:hypothetical protein [Halioxenophilus aromaticivorans]|uniref:Uncharacterized protein n=1 Tax=Halioxenophilus aromaticivorans TaxID=1306992 RepID=A0AAV3U2C6_9ALTE
MVEYSNGEDSGIILTQFIAVVGIVAGPGKHVVCGNPVLSAVLTFHSSPMRAPSTVASIPTGNVSPHGEQREA